MALPQEGVSTMNLMEKCKIALGIAEQQEI